MCLTKDFKIGLLGLQNTTICIIFSDLKVVGRSCLFILALHCLTLSSPDLPLSSSFTTSREFPCMVNQFHGNFRSKTPSCRKLSLFSGM